MKNELNFLVGQNIKKWRTFKEMKQETFAKELKITPAALSQIENGKIDLTISRIENMANILNIDATMFFTNPQTLVNINNSPNSNNNHTNINTDIVNILHEQLMAKDKQIEQLLLSKPKR